MKAFNGFTSEAQNNKPRMLPPGPYVAKIIAVKIDGKEPDQSLVLRLDICEGPFANYFVERYSREKESGKFEPRYKGDFKLRIPNENNTKALYPETDIRRFNDAIFRIEKSNEGYHWDWDEQGLAGKIVGINMQLGEFNGSPYTRIGRLEIADDVRKGIVSAMKPREPRGDATLQTDTQSGMAKVEDAELPWF